MSEWREIAGYPKTFPARMAYVDGAARIVRGEFEMKGNRPVTLPPAKALIQRIETHIIEKYGGGSNLESALVDVFAAYAQHIDVVEWCRVRDDELDVSLRVFAGRGSQRVHLDLRGPVGAYADAPLPEHGKPKRKSRATAAPAPAPAAQAAPAPSATAPAEFLIVCPLMHDAKSTGSDGLARDLDGSMCAVVKKVNREFIVRVDTHGKVTTTPLPSVAELRAFDPTVMSDARLAGVYTTPIGVVFSEHYSRAGSQDHKRIGVRGTWHAHRAINASMEIWLGVHGSYALWCLVAKGKSSVFGVDLESGKTSRVSLPEALEAQAAVVDGGGDALLLRVLDGEANEYRFKLGLGKTLTAAPVSTEPLPNGDSVQPLPNGGWLAARGLSLSVVRTDRTEAHVLACPAADGAVGLFLRSASQLASDEPTWFVTFTLENARGLFAGEAALVFRGDGALVNAAYHEPGGRLRVGASTVALGRDDGYPSSFAAGPAGDLALLHRVEGELGLLWAPPLAARS